MEWAELERMRAVTDDLYKEVRESISELGTRVSDQGLPATVREYLHEYEDRNGITVSLQGEDAARGLPVLTALQLRRIMQEALANVRKHASARNVLDYLLANHMAIGSNWSSVTTTKDSIRKQAPY